MKPMRLLVAACAMLAVAGSAGVAVAAEKKINIGWTAWSDAEAVTKLAQKVMKDRLGYDVQLTLADIGIQYQGVATGKLDGMLMSWQPITHKAYIEKVGKDLVDLGPMYTRAKLGWVVPESIPVDQVKTIEDLK
jgi:glycine betaine/proline transport system substrate-binding protein